MNFLSEIFKNRMPKSFKFLISRSLSFVDISRLLTFFVAESDKDDSVGCKPDDSQKKIEPTLKVSNNLRFLFDTFSVATIHFKLRRVCTRRYIICRFQRLSMSIEPVRICKKAVCSTIFTPVHHRKPSVKIYLHLFNCKKHLLTGNCIFSVA